MGIRRDPPRNTRTTENGCILLRFNAFDVEVEKLDVYLLVVAAVEEVMALGVARVQPGIVGRRERPVLSRVAFKHEAAR